MERGLTNSKAITLIELIISLIITALVIVGFSSIDLFSSRQIVTSNRLLKVQNDASAIIETIAKESLNAIGSKQLPAAYTTTVTIEGNPCQAIVFRIDGDNDGTWKGDKEIAFSYGAVMNKLYLDRNFGGLFVINETVSNTVTKFVANLSANSNYLDLDVETCWNPPYGCGTLDNPQVHVRARVELPSVSVN
jgi:hypothetical protein